MGSQVIRRPDWNAVVDVAVPVGLGGVFFAGSADHVYHLAIAHGQTHLGAWSIVGSMEVLAIWLGLEVKRRRGLGQVPALIGLALAVGFVLAANLASAAPDAWARIMAVAPAAALVVLVAVMETRGSRRRPRAAPRARKAVVAEEAPVGVAPAPGQRRRRNATPDPRLDEVRAEWISRQGGEDPMTTDEVASRLGVKRRMAQNRVKDWSEAA